MPSPPAVADHYGTDDLRDRIAAALRTAGLGEGRLTWSDLAALDQFHTRGLAATEELAALLKLGPDSKVLDVGAGLGGPSRFLAAKFDCRVTGIDLSPGFVATASMLAERCGLADRVEYRQADALALPFPDAAFDTVWTQHVAMNIADRAHLYAEMARVLRPGGHLAVYDVVAVSGDPVFPLPWARTPETSFLLTAAAMRTALEAAGFAVLSWQDPTPSAVSWFARRQAAAAPPPLGLHVIMGREFPAMAANLGRSLSEGLLGLAQAVLQKSSAS